MTATEIEWTDVVWNPTTGCDRVSPGCDHCYALTMARRLKAMGNPKYQRDGDPRTSGSGFQLTVHPAVVNRPLTWRKPRKVFVNSMSDLFHANVPTNWLADIFAVMSASPQHSFQILTKRHARMRSLLNDEAFVQDVKSRSFGKGRPSWKWEWPLPNVWLGVSAENQQWADARVPALLETPAAVRWVSAEPLLGPIDFSHWLALPHERTGLDWVVLGGESGPGARPMDIGWAQEIVAQCLSSRAKVLVKQLGTVAGGKSHHDIATFPPGLRVREYPVVTS